MLHRWSFGWQSPNHAATVIAMCLPIIWGWHLDLGARSISRIPGLLLWIVEIGALELLAMTGSRGGMVGLFGGLLWFTVRAEAATTPRWAGLTASVRFFVKHISAAIGAILPSVLKSRIIHAFYGDLSVLHRFELWTGGLHLIHAAPLAGWGRGESGIAYMQWLQLPSDSTVHGGMVNSYLHLAVEFGLGALCGYCFAIVMPIILCLETARNKQQSRWLTRCGASLIIFSVSSVFTTQWIVVSVSWLPAVLILIILHKSQVAVTASGWKAAFLWSTGISIGISVAVYLLAWSVAKTDKWRLSPMGPGSALLSTGSPSGCRKVLILADRRVLGRWYGKEIRRIYQNTSQSLSLEVFGPESVGKVSSLDGATTVIALGGRLSDAIDISAKVPVICVAPIWPPDKYAGKRNIRKIILSEYDELDVAQSWREWADQHAVECVQLDGVGQDLRSEWKGLRRALDECLTVQAQRS